MLRSHVVNLQNHKNVQVSLMTFKLKMTDSIPQLLTLHLNYCFVSMYDLVIPDQVPNSAGFTYLKRKYTYVYVIVYRNT